MRFLLLHLLAVVFITGCSGRAVKSKPPTAAEEIGWTRQDLQQERALREAIAQVSPLERGVTQRLLADPRIDAVMFAHTNALSMTWMWYGDEPALITQFNFMVVIETNQEMAPETVAFLIRQAMLAENLHPLQDRNELVHHDGTWATQRWRTISATLGPPRAPGALDETSYDHLDGEG